jgi:glycosyltransferase involved in cell wall biosynthesis
MSYLERGDTHSRRRRRLSQDFGSNGVRHATCVHIQRAEGLDVTDGEHILLADDPRTFADCTLQFLRDSELRQRLMVNARCLVERRYDWSQIGQRFVALVEDVAHEHTGGGTSA